MKNITKIIIGLATLILIVIVAMVLLNRRDSQNSTKNSFSSSTSKVSSTSKTSRPSKSSNAKASSSKASSSSTEQASDATVTENSNSAEVVTPSSTQAAPANGSASITAPSADTGSNIAQTQGGYAVATSGTLTLDKATPVYAETDKNSPVIFTMEPGEVNWDLYTDGNGDSWYSFVLPASDGSTKRYYIAYSDVGH